jgi:hypothetical protein
LQPDTEIDGGKSALRPPRCAGRPEGSHEAALIQVPLIQVLLIQVLLIQVLLIQVLLIQALLVSGTLASRRHAAAAGIKGVSARPRRQLCVR